MGYGQISPRNCYEGGQATNCRINRLVLEHATSGACLLLWFHPTGQSDGVERELIRAIQPSWNRALVSGIR
jgi:hypothetical protein